MRTIIQELNEVELHPPIIDDVLSIFLKIRLNKFTSAFEIVSIIKERLEEHEINSWYDFDEKNGYTLLIPSFNIVIMFLKHTTVFYSNKNYTFLKTVDLNGSNHIYVYVGEGNEAAN